MADNGLESSFTERFLYDVVGQSRELVAKSARLKEATSEELQQTRAQLGAGRLLLTAYWARRPMNFEEHRKPNARNKLVTKHSLEMALLAASRFPELKEQAAKLGALKKRRDRLRALLRRHDVTSSSTVSRRWNPD